MRKKILLPLLFLAMMATFTACKNEDPIMDDDDRITISTDTSSEDTQLDNTSESTDTRVDNSAEITYEVKTEFYKKDNISIEYPILEGNIPNIDTLNDTIYNANMAGVEYLTDSYTYEQTIEIKEQSDEIVSILCKAYNKYSTASYPVALFTTFNIDVKTGTMITFEEHEREGIYEKVNNREFEIVDLSEGMDVEEAKDEAIMNFNLSSAYPMYYIQDGVNYYLVPVSHESGDYMTIVLKED